MELLSFGLKTSLMNEETGKRYVEGLASTEDVDWQNDIVLQEGMDFSYLQKGLGRVNWLHNNNIIIGDTISAEKTKDGLFLKAMLYKKMDGYPYRSYFKKSVEQAEWVWDYIQTVQRNGGKPLAYSIEGRFPKRVGNKIVKSVITSVAVTDRPINTNCTIQGLIKSFSQYMATPGLSANDICNGATFVRFMEDHGVDPEETRIVYDRVRNLILGD